MLVLSTPILEGTPNFVCLSYTEQEGILSATASNSCDNFSQQQFNITSSGPCLQALTGGGIQNQGLALTPLLLILTVHVILRA